MKNALIARKMTREEKAEEIRLAKAIQKKKSYLKRLILKTESLQVRLDMVKQEYVVKVESLILKDNLLDLEIIQLRNILSLMDEGMSFDEARAKIKETYYSQQLAFEKEQERMRYDQDIYFERQQIGEVGTDDDLKRIWRSLIMKYHPDLVLDQEEKELRHEVLKKINRAYESRDYDELLRIERFQELSENTSTDTLAEQLIQLENDILAEEDRYTKLLVSEWYEWEGKIKKARKKGKDIFAETERQLLNDIVAKIKVLEELREQVKTR